MVMRALLVVTFCALMAAPASAQREFIEEVEKNTNVDLDAPDPADVKNKPAPDPPPAPAPSPTTTPNKPAPPPPKDPKDPKAKDPKGKATLEFEPIATFQIVESSRDAFVEKAVPHFSAAMRSEVTRARQSLPGLERGAVEAAIHGGPGGYSASAAAMAWIREANKAKADERDDDAKELISTALDLAPTDASVVVAALRLRLSTDGVGAVLGDIGTLPAAIRASPVDRGDAIGRAAAAGVIAVLLLLLVVALCSAVPVLSIVAFDVVTRLPRGVFEFQGVILVGLAIVAPFMLGAGIVPSLAWVCVVAAAAITGRARVFVGAVLALTALLPQLVDVAAKGFAAPVAPSTVVHRALFDIDGATDVAALLRREQEGQPLDLLAKVAIANAARREGRVDEAVTRFKELVQRHGELSYVHGGYAVALAVAGQSDLALAELGIAIERGRGERDGKAIVAAASFNASLLHHAAGRPEKAQSMLQGLSDQGPTVLARFRRATFRAVDEVVQQNRAFIEILPPRSTTSVLEDSSAAAAAYDAAAQLWRGLPKNDASIVLAILAVVFAVFGAVSTKLAVARPCERCGAPASRRVDGPEVPATSCASCFHTFLSTTSRVDAIVRHRKEAKIRRWHRRRAAAIVALSVIPGAGHLFAGAGARAAALLIIALLAVGGGVMASPLWPTPRVVGTDIIGVIPFIVVYGLMLLIALRSALGLAADERGGLR